MSMTATSKTDVLRDFAESANAAHLACESAARSVVVHARDCGDVLLSAKRRLKHGQFAKWIKENCVFSERMAQRYIAIANYWGSKPKTTRASDLKIDDCTIRQVLNLIQQEKTEKSGVFKNERCPSCNSRLAEIKPGVVTCPNCWECRLYGTGKPVVKRADKKLYDAFDAWRWMGDNDRAEFIDWLKKQTPKLFTS